MNRTVSGEGIHTYTHRGGDTHTHTQTYRHPHRNNFKKPGSYVLPCGQLVPGLIR